MPTISFSQAPGSVFALGTTRVFVTATDAVGNSRAGEFRVIVVDTTAPALTLPADQIFEASSAAGALVSYTGASATDAVSAVAILYSQSSGTVFALGSTRVTVTATDAAGNRSTGGFTVTVRDITGPSLTVPPNQVVDATSPAGALVEYPQATATDTVSTPTIAYSQASGTLFPIGATVVTVTASDAAGNTTVKSFTVTVREVRDTTPPVLTVPPNQVVEATAPTGAIVIYQPATATDDRSTPTITYSQASGTVFALGVTTVTVTATDVAGNKATGSFTVTVRDATAPRGTITVTSVTSSCSDDDGDEEGGGERNKAQVGSRHEEDGGDDDGDCGDETGNHPGAHEHTDSAGAAGTLTIALALAFTDAVGPVSMRFSLDTGRTWTAFEPYATTKTLTAAAGTASVLAQVKDAAGNVGQATASLSVPSPVPPPAPPTITTTIASGSTCDICRALVFRYDVSGTSTSRSATLDGISIANGATIDGFTLAAGTHRIVITTGDALGRVTTRVVTFEVHATIEGLICAVERAAGLGLVAREQKQALLAKLYAAKASRDRGNGSSVAAQLGSLQQDLLAQRGKKIDVAFADRAIGWTNDLISRIRGGAGNSESGGPSRRGEGGGDGSR
jgi:hypothetical protein